MEWLLEGLLGAEGDMGLLWGLLTYALACRHCGNSCFQSPGNLVTLFLFIVWQIRRWRQFGRWPQLQPWCTGNVMQNKGLPLLYRVSFLECLWKQISEEEEDEGMEEEEEEEDTSLYPLKPYSPPKEVPIGEQTTLSVPQLSCGSEGFLKASGTPKQILTQPLNSSRSFPTFQILTNLPVRHTTAPGNHLQQRKSQLFWGLPSLHSEFLEATFLNSADPSSQKLSVVPSIFFNMVAFLPKPNLLLPQYCPTTQLPTHQAHTIEDLKGLSPDPQLPPPPDLSPSLHFKNFSAGHKGALSVTEANAQLLSQQRDDPWVPKDQALHTQLEFKKTSPFKFLSSSEAFLGVPWDPSLQQLNPDLCSASLPYPSSTLGVMTGFEAPRRIVGQNDLNASKSAMSVPIPTPVSLPEFQEANPLADLSGSKAHWEMGQRENPQISKPPALTPYQPLDPMTEPQATRALGVPPRYETHWRTTIHKNSLQASESPKSTLFQPPISLSESHKVHPEGRLHSSKNFWETTVQRQNPQASELTLPALCLLPTPQSELHGGSALGDPSGSEVQLEHKENSGNPRAFKPTDLDFNPCSVPLPGIYGTSLAYVSSGSEALWKNIQRRKNLWVSVDPVLPPSTFLLKSTGINPQGVLPESKVLWETMGQRENLWASRSPAPVLSSALAHLLESHRINPMGGLEESETAWKDIEHSSNSWAAEPASLVLSPHLALILGSFRVSSSLESKAICGDMQRRKDSWVSELPGCSLPQGLHGANPQEILSDSRLVREVMEQKNCCAPVPPNSVSKNHVIEPIGDQWDYRPEGEVVEQRKNCYTTELLASAPSSLFAPTPEVPFDSEFGWGYRRQSEVPQGFSPPALDLRQPMLWPPALAETLKIPHIQPDLIKEELFPGAKEEIPPSQEEVVRKIPTHPGVQVWQWSRELELRLKKLQQNATSRFPGLRQPPCSFPATGSLTLGSWECSSCSPQQAPNVCPCSSSCHFQEFQGIVPQPDEGSYCHHPHPSSQSQSLGSSRAKPRSQEEERVKKKVVAQVFLEASDRHPGLGESSNSGKMQNKVSTLPSTKKREYPKKPHPGGDAVVSSTTVTGNHLFAQGPRLVEPPVNRLSPKSQSKNQSFLHTALPRLLPKTEGHQNQWGAGMGAGDMPDPQHCKHCKRYLSSTPQALPARSLRRVLAKFLGTLGPQPTKANQQRKG